MSTKPATVTAREWKRYTCTRCRWVDLYLVPVERFKHTGTVAKTHRDGISCVDCGSRELRVSTKNETQGRQQELFASAVVERRFRICHTVGGEKKPKRSRLMSERSSGAAEKYVEKMNQRGERRYWIEWVTP